MLLPPSEPPLISEFFVKPSQTEPTSQLRPFFARVGSAVKRWVVFQTISLFRVSDGSEAVARGFALGMIVNFFPTFGFGVVVSGFVARFFGGNALAGIIGGATLAFAWPLLFLLNMQVGGVFYRSPIVVDELEDVTEKTVSALVWGKTFMAGAVVNGLVGGLISYAAVFYTHSRLRPKALAYFRGRAKRRRARKSVRKKPAPVR